MTYLDRAIKDGYAIITGPENKQKIIYVTSDNHTENYNDPEEKVRAEFWAELIYEYDYPAHRIKVEVTIPDRVPTDRADIVIFSDDECKKPYAVVECKRDGVTDAEFLQAIEQGVGNATWVKLRASYVVIIAGATRRVLDFSDDSTGILERENNIIADLPKAYGKPQAFRFYRGGEYTDVDGKKKKAPDIQPVAREDYVCCQKAKVSSNKLVVDFEVNSSKIASDIAEAIDRSVEYSVIGELLQPLVCLSKDSYSELFEKMELTSGQKKTLGTTAVRIDYYFNPDTYEIKETDVSELSIRKQIAKICAAAGVLPGTYERRDATEIVRKIQESVVSHLEQAIRTLERDRLHILLLSALATEQLSVNLNRTGATLTEDIEEGERIKSLEKSTQLSEKAKMRKSALLYLIETNLYLVNERKEEAIDSSKLSELLSFAKWIIYLQNSSDLCFHTDSDTKLIVEDDYRIDVELGENYSQTFEKESQRRIIAEPFNLRGDNTDRDFFEKVANAFYEDLGVHFKVLESVLHHLSDSSFSHDNVEFDEIAPNVIKAKATDVLNDYLSFVVENVPVEDVKSAYDFLTIVPGQLKTICDTTHPILPIWEREKRNHCFAVRPIYMSNNDYIYSPIIMEEVRKRWIEGFLQFYPPFEIGLERTCTALYAWKNNYEHLFSSEVEVLLKESGCEYAKHDVDLRREDRRGNHPTIDVLGDYDVIGLNTTQKRIFIIECKVLQPIGSVFEHSNQQKRFFTKEKFDEKFQKRIDYFSKVAMSFFANHGYDTEGFTINPYMVVNKVFSSYYKHVQFPIVTFDELKREIQL